MKRLAILNCTLALASASAFATTTTNLDCFVEYIQSSGTQWIDTGVIGKSSVNMAADVTVLSSAGSSCLIGERPSGSDKSVRLGLWIGSQYKWGFNCGSLDSSWQGSALQNTRCVVSNENGRLWVAPYGGTPTKIYNGADQIFASSLPLTMFFLNTATGLDQGSNRPLQARVYGLTLYDNGAIVRDFHPCQVTISDTVAGTSVTKYGLWDKVGSRFYGDQSGGTDFTAGNAVANDPVVVVAPDARGLEGVEPPGSYTVNDTQTFSATNLTVGPLVWSPVGYALEIWDGVNGKWTLIKTEQGSSFTYVSSAGRGTVRLKWLWSQTGNLRCYDVGDYIHSAGLFAHFDGVYNSGLNAAHASSVSTWVNLAGGDFNLARQKADAAFSDDAWVANGTVYFNATSLAVANALLAKSFTLEMMISAPPPPANTYAVWAFFGNNKNNRQLGVDIRSGDSSNPLVQGIQYRGGGSWNADAKVPNVDDPITKWNTRQYIAVVCDGNTASGYCDGANLFHSITAAGVDPTLELVGIGAQNDGTSPLKNGSQVCAVRMTADVLADWQLEHNSAVDHARFTPNVTVVNGEIGETGEHGESSAPDGDYDLVSGTCTFTAGVAEAAGTSYAPKLTVETLENGAWVVAEDAHFVNSYTLDKTELGDGRIRLTWTWTAPLTILPIPEQNHDNGEPCRPEVVVSNVLNGATWMVGGDISSPYFDAEYTGNNGIGTATVTVTGKGDFAGAVAQQTFAITATKFDDVNISVSDPTVRRFDIGGKYVYVFTNAASAQTVAVKRELLFTDYLVVGGGGGGGNTSGGGGGGGGVTNATGLIAKRLVEGDTFTVSVGAGGAGAGNYNAKGTNGKASSFQLLDISVSVAGGGGGGSWFTPDGVSGASGGGGAKGGAGGAGIAGIGHDGAAAGSLSRSGGGGGAGHAGYQYTDGSTNRAGNGGEGISSGITGEVVYYGGGGGGGGSSGGNDNYYPGFGGLGGGGDGERSIPGHPGADGFGGGGGGGGWANNQQQRGSNGGSGTVILALMRPVFEVVPISNQVNETFEPCCPVFVVSNNQTAATWTVGGDIASPYFDVEYTNNFGACTATVTVIGKGELYGAYCVGHFNVTATKLEDENISTTDLLARRFDVDGKAVYIFAGTESVQTVTAKRGINLTDYLVVGGGGGGGAGQGGGGGGAGGVTNATGLADAYVAKGDTFTVVVGAGGAGSPGQSDKGVNGGMSSLRFGTINVSAPGGGGGGSWSTTAGAAGASGGGGAQAGAGGTGIEGFGYAGATGLGANCAGAGGGGGVSHAGYQGNTSLRVSGNGGEGVSNIITGAWVVYGGGGGGGGAHQSLWWKYDVGLGGLGGGGDGGKDTAGCDGVDGLGGGGGGGGAGFGGATAPISLPGGKGGSGTVIVAIKAADFEVDQIPDQYLVAGGCEPLPVVRDGATVLVKDTDYTVAYANNTQAGTATITITGINGYAGKSASVGFKITSRYYARPTVSSGGDGLSWTTAMSVAGAFAAAEAETGFREIWIQSGTVSQPAITIANSGALTIRGGFAGTESTLDQRQPGALTIFDGENTANILLAIDNATDDDVVLDRIKFCRAKSNGLVKTGKGGLRAYECAFEANGSGAARAYGHGLNAQSDGYGSLVVSDCVFAGNKNVSGDTQYGGFGLYVNKFNDALVENSLFVTNGYNIAKAENAYCGMYTKGSAIFVVDTPITVRGSRFAGNCCPIRKSLGGADGSGGVVALTGASGGSRFENCAFVGNTECRSIAMYTSDGCGALAVYLNSVSAKAAVNNCTFAYNLTQGGESAGGITVLKGSVDISNSIFWKNARYLYTKSGYATDVQAQANGSATIRDSIVTSLDGTALGGANLVVDADTVFAGDPRFVTSTADYENLLVVTDSTMYYDYSRASRYADLAAMDAHLLSPAGYVVNGGAAGPATASTSPAIDAGDPEADYSNEPSPNGGRLNLGAYGNTAEASRTAIGQPEATVAVVFPGGEARPAAQVTMGLESGNGYLATVHVVCSTNGVTLAEETFRQIANGDVLELKSPSYLPLGTVFDVAVAIDAPGAESRTYNVSQAVAGTYPPFYGKGGGPNVIHVRTGADGLMDGSDWENAYPDLRAAFASVPDASKTEVWLSVTNDYLDAAMTLDRTLTFRGGFTGAENSPAERPEGLRSLLDGNDYYKTMQIAVPSGMLLTVDRIHFRHSADSELKKTGAGDLIVRDCWFTDSRQDGEKLHGRGVNVSGGGNVTVTNCSFFNVLGPQGQGTTYPGGAMYISSCAQAHIDDCLFVTNGTAFKYTHPNWADFTGAAIYANATPTMIRNCRFAACCAVQRYAYSCGGIVYFNGACNGSKVVNCAFTGNGDFESGNTSNAGTGGGAIDCNMANQGDMLDIENCTIAFNLTQGLKSAAGINISKGTVNLKNSIVYGNLRGRPDNFLAGADIDVKSGATLNISYSLVTGTTTNYVGDTAGAGTINWGQGVLTSDPLLQTTTNNLVAILATNSNIQYIPASATATVAAFDVHPRTHAGYFANGVLIREPRRVESPTTDAGDPSSDYALEPVVPGVGGNGHRINMGAYGNTPEAAMTPIRGTMLIMR